MPEVLTAELLLDVYRQGCFPMARGRDSDLVHLFSPDPRGIIPLDTFHVPRSLRKAVRGGRFEIRVDTAFEAVIRACGEPAPDRPETWLNEGLIQLYLDLHRRGFAHSVETWRDGLLVGGLYGVSQGAAFFGESMFSRVTDASKVALVALVDRLRRGGYRLLDTQYVTDHLIRFGAREVPREEYMALLREALGAQASF
ncbi:leucyl/phenylalanyl-tRNA--protein transferase [Geminicoccaceae bacterium 1502E]|nr:leucyl/phenylalanyl-tRNA--protein transferase [Geminicoccaceae bacterium 1502E]